MKNIKNLDLWNNTQKFRDEYAEKTGKAPYANAAICLKWYAYPIALHSHKLLTIA